MNAELKRVAIYARVSSEKQDTDLSISAQLKALGEYAARNGWLVVREFVNEAESGRTALGRLSGRWSPQHAGHQGPSTPSWCGNTPALPEAGRTLSPIKPCSGRMAFRWSP